MNDIDCRITLSQLSQFFIRLNSLSCTLRYSPAEVKQPRNRWLLKVDHMSFCALCVIILQLVRHCYSFKVSARSLMDDKEVEKLNFTNFVGKVYIIVL
jgi:hypothetical protein